MPDTDKMQTMGEEAARGLNGTLVSLLGRDDAEVLLKDAAEWDSETAAQAVDGPFLSAVLQGEGPAAGGSLLLAKEKDACILADLLIGQDGANAPDHMTELHVSAFGEVVNQMAVNLGQAAHAIGSAKASFRVKSASVLDAAGVAGQVRKLGAALYAFTFSVSVPGLVASEMYLYLPDPVAEKLAAAPGGTPPPEAVQAAGVKSTAPSGVQHTGGASVQQVQQDPYAGGSTTAQGNIGLLMDVPLRLTVELGRTTKLVKEILALAPGAVVELDKLAGEPVDIQVNDKLIAKGEVVVIDENFGVRITEIVNPEERLSGLHP